MVYVKKNIQFERLHYPGEIPVVVINTHQMSIALIYSEFTRDKTKLSQKDRVGRLFDFLLWFGANAKRKAVVMGDMNVNWGNLEDNSRNKLQSWAQDNDFVQAVTLPTRIAKTREGHISQTTIDLCFVRERRTSVVVTDPCISDHHAVLVNISRPKKKVVRKEICQWKVTPSIIEHARQNPVTLTVGQDDMTNLVHLLTGWMQNINQMAVTKRIVIDKKSNEWYTEELAVLQAQMKLATGAVNK